MDETPEMYTSLLRVGQWGETGAPLSVQTSRVFSCFGFVNQRCVSCPVNVVKRANKTGVAASVPLIIADPFPSKFPNQTPIVNSGEYPIHHASRCPYEVPVFHAIFGRFIALSKASGFLTVFAGSCEVVSISVMMKPVSCRSRRFDWLSSEWLSVTAFLRPQINGMNACWHSPSSLNLLTQLPRTRLRDFSFRRTDSRQPSTLH